MFKEGNRIKNRLLGMSHGAASNRLRKMLLWQLVVETGQDVCFQCDEQIANIDDLSIDHKEPWQGADDPKAAFFDLHNIAFSHLSCNCGAGMGSGKANAEKTHCKRGHPLSGDNLYITASGKRQCKDCARRWQKEFQTRRKTDRIGKVPASKAGEA